VSAERVTNQAGTVCPACRRDDWHVRGSIKCEQLELELLRARASDIDTLDAHVRTLHGGSYWSSSNDSCGVHDAVCPEDNWHRHGRDENDARHEAAEHIRNTPRCDWVSGWGSRCQLPAGHASEGHLVSA
jgi:hypothetical protein